MSPFPQRAWPCSCFFPWSQGWGNSYGTQGAHPESVVWLLHLVLLHHTPLPPALSSLVARGTFSAALCDRTVRDRTACLVGSASSRAVLGSPAVPEQLWLSWGRFGVKLLSVTPHNRVMAALPRDAAGSRDLHCFLYNVLSSLDGCQHGGSHRNHNRHGYFSIYARVHVVFAYLFPFRDLSIFNKSKFTIN